MKKKFGIHYWVLFVLVSGSFQMSKAALCCFSGSQDIDSQEEESHLFLEEQNPLKKSKIVREKADTTHKKKKAYWHDDCDECEKIQKRLASNALIDDAVDEVLGLLVEKTLKRSLKKVIEQDSESLVHCDICLLVSSNKRVLHATANGVQHSFCKRCLQECLEKNVIVDYPWRTPLTLPCPLCRFTVPARQVEELCRSHCATN